VTIGKVRLSYDRMNGYVSLQGVCGLSTVFISNSELSTSGDSTSLYLSLRE